MKGPDFKYFIDNAPIPFALLEGQNFVFSYINIAFKKILNGQEIIGKTFDQAMPHLMNTTVKTLLEESFQTGNPLFTQKTAVHSIYNESGQTGIRFFDLSYTPYKDEQGNVEGVLVSSVDVTASVALQQKEEHDSSHQKAYWFLMQAPVAIGILRGSEYIVELANDPLLELWDKDASVIGKPLSEVLATEGQNYIHLLNKLVKHGHPFHANEYAVTILRKGKPETVYINLVFQPYYEEDGSVLGIMIVASDVTEQVKARKKIEYAEERARLAISSADLGTYEVNLKTNEIYPSPRFNSIYGFDHNMNRNDYVSVLHPDDVAIRNKAHEESLQTGNLDYEARIFRKDGSMHWIRVQGKVFYNENGEPESLLGVVQDISEHKLFAEELAKQVKERTKELEETNNELGEFAKISSHDLQEPLRKIMWFTQMIKEIDEKNLSDLSKVYFDKILTSANRMSSSLNDLLNFSSLGKEERFQMVDLNTILSNVLSDLEYIIHQKDAVIKNLSLPTLRAIPLQMNQLFYNLLNNALKFSKSSAIPVIEISTHLLNETERKNYHELDILKEFFKITIKDNGIGFEQEQAQKIFTMFERLHSREAFTGTGIGLALCKKVVLNHGGTIYASSEPGKGATFHVILPKE